MYGVECDESKLITGLRRLVSAPSQPQLQIPEPPQKNLTDAEFYHQQMDKLDKLVQQGKNPYFED